jgi:hypothetical protein
MSEDIERWLPVVGWEGLYEVSSHGQVRSLDRWVTMKNGRRRPHRGRVLRPGLYAHYLVVVLSDGIKITKYVHDLVLRAFVGPPPLGMECLHGPNGQLNNRLGNLSWGTRCQNMMDKQRDGTDFHRNITHCPRGHTLEEPNLIRSGLIRGYRSCLACNRALSVRRNYLNRGESYDFLALADEYYAEIMKHRQ